MNSEEIKIDNDLYTVSAPPKYKSKLSIGNTIIFSTKHFNWFRKLMYKLVFDIKIEDFKGEE